MDSLPHSLLLEILSRLDDSADVARCRVASKAFNAVFPGLRSIHLRYSKEVYFRASINHRITPFMTVFLDLISKLETVESICISIIIQSVYSDDFHLTDDDFAKVLQPRVSVSLKSLSVTHDGCTINGWRPSSFLSLISKCCHNLVNLELRSGCLSVKNLNPMPMLTSLTLEHLKLEDEDLNELNKCFPNLQFLKFSHVALIGDPKIHLLNLKTLHWVECMSQPSLTIITPSLITLTIDCIDPRGFHIEAPMLSHFRLCVQAYGDNLMPRLIEVKTLWLEALDIGYLLSRFPITKTVDTLTLDTKTDTPRQYTESEFSLGKVFQVFPNLSSLCFKPGAWLELEAWLNPQSWEILYGGWERVEPSWCSASCSCCLNSHTWLEIKSRLYPKPWEILDGRTGLKRLSAYLTLDYPSLTFESLACVVDQCIGLSEVSLLIHSDVDGTVSKGLMSKCMDHWPRLKWRWGIWSKNKEDSWIVI